MIEKMTTSWIALASSSPSSSPRLHVDKKKAFRKLDPSSHLHGYLLHHLKTDLRSLRALETLQLLHLGLGELRDLLQQLPPHLAVRHQLEEPLGSSPTVEQSVRVHEEQQGHHLLVRQVVQPEYL